MPRLLLIGLCPLVDDEADGPVAFAHDSGRVSDDRKVEAVELQLAVAAVADMKREGKRAQGQTYAQLHVSK